jgi:ankyrin repeat protein
VLLDPVDRSKYDAERQRRKNSQEYDAERQRRKGSQEYDAERQRRKDSQESEAAAWLSKYGLEIESRNDTGHTMLQWAAALGYETVVQQLLEKGPTSRQR